VLCDYVVVWAKVDGMVFDDLTSDRFIWRWTADGTYSASSAYRAFFIGMTSLRGAKELWKTRAPPKCKFFFWLLLHDRLWTMVQRMQHGLQDGDACALCGQEQETARHLAGECVFAREVWFRVLTPIGLAILVPPPGIAFLDWWLLYRVQLETAKRKGFDSLIILGAWCLWKECNQRVFHGIEEEVDRWSQAGYGHLAAQWASRDIG
jgi:hypothetical protein